MKNHKNKIQINNRVTIIQTENYMDEFKNSNKPSITIRDIAWALFVTSISIFGWYEYGALMDE